RLVALEEPLFVWEVDGAGPVQLMADLRFRAERVHYERAEDGSRVWLGAESPADELLVTCYGGTLEVRDAGDRLRLHASGSGRVRLVIVASWSEEDRDRTLRGLARKGIAGVVAQQVRHGQMLAALGVKVTTPDRDEDQQVERDKREFESTLHERRAGGRILEMPHRHGSILLALGLREPVRDTLRAPLTDPERRRLFAAYAAWAGADDFVRRHWARALQAVREADEGAEDLREVAEALGDHSAVELLNGISGTDGRGDRAPYPAVDQGAASALGRWHIIPAALEGMVSLAPELPAGWPDMTLERLRVGETSLDLRVKRRPTGIAVKLRVTRGPPLVVALAPRLDFTPTGILLDGELLAGPTVRFTAEGEVEAVWVA
ncbi:MAG: hypothetical protein JF590_01040, partial [Gemmatimonadetes bacterium]|nr:hypothetical protein [Gemmatimonadota bacterium]